MALARGEVHAIGAGARGTPPQVRGTRFPGKTAATCPRSSPRRDHAFLVEQELGLQRLAVRPPRAAARAPRVARASLGQVGMHEGQPTRRRGVGLGGQRERHILELGGPPDRSPRKPRDPPQPRRRAPSRSAAQKTSSSARRAARRSRNGASTQRQGRHGDLARDPAARHLFQDDVRVDAAEPERVDRGATGPRWACAARAAPPVTKNASSASAGVGLFAMQARWQDLAREGERALDERGHARRRQRVPDHRLHRAHDARRHAVHRRAEDLADRLDLRPGRRRACRCRAPRARPICSGSSLASSYARCSARTWPSRTAPECPRPCRRWHCPAP